MIEALGLSRIFGTFPAVDDVSFEIPSGTICALLGPNGAGKSTLLKMLTGLLAPTAGAARVAGLSSETDSRALKMLIGVLPETLALFDSLSIEEHLKLSGAVYGLSPSDTKLRTKQLLETLALSDDRARFLSQCSYGMRKKTALALALLHNPQVLFLDEPFEGLDPVTAKTIRDLLTAAAARGVTILLTSHILLLVNRIAQQIMMLRKGKLVWNSASADLPRSVEDLYFDLVEAPRAQNLRWLGSR
jgi:ABC-2 type transport system ATP-binding protein